MNLSKDVKITRVAAAAAAGSTDVNGDSVDMAGFEGVLFIALFGTITAGAATGLHAQQSADDADADDFTDLAGTGVSIADDRDGDALLCEVFRPLKRYVRPVVDRATQNAVLDGVLAIQYGAGSKPTVHDIATIAGSVFAHSPAEGTP